MPDCLVHFVTVNDFGQARSTKKCKKTIRAYHGCEESKKLCQKSSSLSTPGTPAARLSGVIRCW